MSIRNLLTGLFMVLSFLSKATCTFVPSVVAVTPAVCYGTCTGTATIMISGTTGPYVISGVGSPVTTTGSPVTIMGLCPGVNTLLITDAASCSTPVIVTISQPAELVASATPTPGTGCTGSITVSATGGTGAVVYSIDGGTTYHPSATFTGLCPGTYTACVQDANGCVDCVPVTLSAGCSMVSTVGGITNTTCYGVCDGSAVVASTLGTAPYTATLSPGGATYTYTGSTGMSGLCAGTYTINITDAAGCTNTYTFTIAQPPALTLSVSTTNESIPGACDGTASLTASGGTPAYVYTKNDGSGPVYCSSSVSGLCGGTYTFCAIDANACQTCTTAVIGTTSCSGMVSTVYTTSPITCYGNCDAVVTLASTGGTPPYSVVSPVGGSTVTYASSTTFSGLCAGTYTFYITDAAGCTNIQVLTVTQPSQIVVGATVVNESAPGACDGSITVTATGGFSPYVYSIDGGVTWSPSPFNGLCSGTYTVCAEDINGCVSCTTYVVGTAGCTLTASLGILFPPTCHGSCDGVAIINISGGTSPYTTTVGSSSYASSGPVTIPGLCAGIHTATIVDAAGCTTNVTFTMTEPSAMITTIFVVSNPSGASTCDGVINGAVTGGTPAYAYTWVSCPSMSPTGIVTAPPASGFCAGTYAFIVTDANGCTDTSTCVTLSGPTGMVNLQTETVEVYPNPTSGVLNIRTGSKMPLRLVLTDLLGKRLADLPLNGESSVDLNALGIRNGIYFIALTSEGKIIHTQKIVLTR